MTLFTLPTTGRTSYRGRYPFRVRSVSYSKAAGLHVELNNGTRLWTMHPAALPHINAPELPRAGTGFETCAGQAVPMTSAQYAVLLSAAEIRRTITGLQSGSPEGEQSRAMLLQLSAPMAPAPESEAAERAESCLILGEAEASAAPETGAPFNVVDGSGAFRCGSYARRDIAESALAMLKGDRKPDADSLRVVATVASAAPSCVSCFLVSGNPIEPCSTDLIAQTATIPVGTVVPEGWRVLTGNNRTSSIARVAYRYEIED